MVPKLIARLKLIRANIKLFLRSPQNTMLVHPKGGLGNKLCAINSSVLLGKQLGREIYVVWKQEDMLAADFNDLFLIPSEFQITTVDPYFTGTNYKDKLNSSNIFVKLAGIFRKLTAYYLAKRGWVNLKKTKNRDNFFFFFSATQLSPPLKDGSRPKPPIIKTPIKNSLYSTIAEHINFEQVKRMRDVVIDTWCDFLGDPAIRNKFFGKTIPPEDYSYLVPTSELQKRINKIASLFNDATIGVHLRMGPDKQDTDWKKREAKSVSGEPRNYSTLETFIELMRAEIRENNAANFFVASDSKKTIEHLKSLFGKRIIYQQSTNLTRDSVTGVKVAVVDLFLLSKTKLIIGSYISTFSEVASQIGGIELVVADKNTMKNTQKI